MDLSDVPAELRAPVGAALDAAGIHNGHIAVELVHQGKMRTLNYAHRGVDEATDVLAFPIDEQRAESGPREAGRRLCLPGQGLRRGRGGGARHPPPLRISIMRRDGGEMLVLQERVMASLR